MSAFTDFDRHAMTRALELAARGLDTTDPNPRVGCVLSRNGAIVGEGWHARAGEPHAEVHALQAAGTRAQGATAYVTLEPCSHHGRTPPCADALIAAKVARVVYALRDPNPEVDGAGAARLRAAGIDVVEGLLAREAEELNIGFVSRLRRGRPWLRLKQAASLDGRTALASGESRWITSEAARADVHRWRARSSAVMTGIGTILADDPLLNVRPESVPAESIRQPLRVVLDSRLRTPPTARLFSVESPVCVIGGEGLGKEAAGNALAAVGASVELLPVTQGRPDLDAVLTRLGELEVNELWVEAGPTLGAALLAYGLVDEYVVYLAPILLGVEGRPLVNLAEPPTIADALGFAIHAVETVGCDLRIVLRPRAA